MYEQVEKSKEKNFSAKRQEIREVNSVAHKNGNRNQHIGMVDKRSEIITQRAMTKNTPKGLEKAAEIMSTQLTKIGSINTNATKERNSGFSKTITQRMVLSIRNGNRTLYYSDLDHTKTEYNTLPGAQQRDRELGGDGVYRPQPIRMNSDDRRIYKEYTFSLGIRDTPVENADGYLEHRSTLPRIGKSSYPHGSPSGPNSTPPPHITDLRRDETVTGYQQFSGPPGGPFNPVDRPFQIHQRIHKHIAHGAISAPIIDRYLASAPNECGGYDLYVVQSIEHPQPHSDQQGKVYIILTNGQTTERPISPRTQAR